VYVIHTSVMNVKTSESPVPQIEDDPKFRGGLGWRSSSRISFYLPSIADVSVSCTVSEIWRVILIFVENYKFFLQGTLMPHWIFTKIFGVFSVLKHSCTLNTEPGK